MKMENQTIAYKLVSEYHNVITDFYKGLMLGCNGQCYSRLYPDLHSKENRKKETAKRKTA